ncbi:hypothetical protein PNQ29_12250 [Halobacterium salinarum]|uniref:hypothetical protein n=1 Tax=Halobacterium salinarum TaxID=2242 RepID=UPI00255680BA|nr:hypothetical protein [Halobacterium salinarum]MDL0120491.1 hypothetical protein [Halobacterium salinarum]
MAVESLRDRILVGAGVIAVSVGAYLPWLKINPTLPLDAEIPTILVTGMKAGFESFDFALLGLVGLVLLSRVGSRKRLQTAITLLTGVGIALFCASYLSGSSLAGFDSTFVPALGWYLTVLGGVLLTVVGGLQSASIIQRPEATAALID